MFWSKEKVASWEAQVFPPGSHQNGAESTKNFIALSCTTRRLWNQGAFALKPVLISTDKKTLILQFFWQARQPDVSSTMSLLTRPLPTKNLDNGNGYRLATEYTPGHPKLVESGDLIAMTTDDPKTRPLPSFELLELQWFLQRVMGMAGAAVVNPELFRDSDSYYSDSDDDISSLSDDTVVQPTRPGE